MLMGKSRHTITLVSAVLPLLAGCQALDLQERTGRRTFDFVGAVRVAIPETLGDITAIDVATVGVGADTSVFVGWRHSQFVFANSDKCQLLIIVRSDVEAIHAAKLLNSVQGEHLCVANFSETVRQ